MSFLARVRSAVASVEDSQATAARRPAYEAHAFVEITSTTQTSGRYPGNYRIYDATAKTWSDGDDCWVVDANGAGLVTGKQYRGRIWETNVGSPSKVVVIVDRDDDRAKSVTETTIGTDQDNYEIPTDVLIVTPSAPFNMNGVAAPSSGSRIIEIVNAGSNTISFPNNVGTSTAANRFTNSAGLTLAGGASGFIVYDTVTDRWRLMFPASATVTPGTQNQYFTTDETGVATAWRGGVTDLIAATTLAATDKLKTFRNTSGTDYATTLPTLAATGSNWLARFYNDGTNTWTIQRNGADPFLDGTTGFALTQDQWALVINSGAGGWAVFAITDGCITTARLASNAVTTAKILDANVTAAKLGPLNAFTNESTVADADRFPFYKDSAAANRDCAASDLAAYVLASGINSILINDDMRWHQRQDATTATARSDDTYGPDRWVVLTQTASVTNERSTGDRARYAAKLNQNQAAAQRMGLLQIVEGVNSKPLRSKTMIAQCRVKISNSQAVRIAILEWTGTEDSVTSDVVNDWTSSTYTAGNFFLGSNLTVTAVAAVTPSAATWTTLSVSGTAGASVNNLIVLVWTEGTAAQNVTLELSEVDLFTGTATRIWQPRPAEQSLALCLRYYEAGAPGNNPARDGAYDLEMTCIATTTGNGVQYGQWPYLVAKRVNPTVTIRPYTTAANTGRVSNSTGTDLAASSGSSVGGINRLAIQNDSGSTVTTNGLILFKYEADAEL